MQPIRWKKSNKYYTYQTGVFIYGNNDLPKVHTSVQYFVDWIKERVEE